MVPLADGDYRSGWFEICFDLGLSDIIQNPVFEFRIVTQIPAQTSIFEFVLEDVSINAFRSLKNESSGIAVTITHVHAAIFAFVVIRNVQNVAS
ncbi:hypothetical protein D3C84_662590 [compost metagenome]